ncbi:MAG TPA: hypothetical protein P5513_04125 [Candidatus Diapherotrites archaeon]|nr:hypothetical protein [Candidatus Diapherotrites archaeon]
MIDSVDKVAAEFNFVRASVVNNPFTTNDECIGIWTKDGSKTKIYLFKKSKNKRYYIIIKGTSFESIMDINTFLDSKRLDYLK